MRKIKYMDWTDYAYIIFEDNEAYNITLNSQTSTKPPKYTYTVSLNYVKVNNNEKVLRQYAKIFDFKGQKYVSFSAPEIGESTLLITSGKTYFDTYTFNFNMTGIN